jgi:hypothetical protein
MTIVEPLGITAPASTTTTPGHRRRDLIRRASLIAAGAGALFVADAAVRSSPAAAAVQGNWRYCIWCKSLFHAGSSSTNGRCPVNLCGTPFLHNSRGSYQYLLSYGLNPVPSNYQPGWRFCSVCRAMWYSGFSGNARCYSSDCNFPEKGHSEQGSGQYSIATSGLSGQVQTGWRYCSKCYSLFYGPHASSSRCFAGGQHNVGNSANYWLPYVVD